MDKKVYSSLKLSYNYLQNKEVKLLFLLCSIFPEDFLIKVEDLHVFAVGMGLLHGVDTVAQGRCRVTKLVDDLISSLLLQYEGGDTYVKMHDLVRDVAILIASDDDQIRTLNYVNRSKEWKEEKISGNHTAVYLDVKGLHSLPQKLMLPKVQLLMLRGAVFEERHELAPTFFEEMKEVKGLELNRMKVSESPPSLYSFANVRLLHLIDCELGNIDMIGELKRLEILSFKGSNIIQIPLEISQLTQLKVFDLSSCNRLEVIPPNILSRLTKLEELYLETFGRWEGEELNKKRKNASLSELKYLPHLCRLNLWIQDEKIMPKQLFSTELNLEKFNIAIGIESRMVMHKGFSRTLYLKMESGSCLDDWIEILLKRCEELQLVGSIGARVLTFELVENECSHLKHLHLFKNREFQHLIHQQNKPLRKTLSNLEDLQLRCLENLESIIDGHGHVTELAFNKLRSVDVEYCHKMGTLFYNCMVDDILNLEDIFIYGCEMLEYLITVTMESKETTATIEFPHLKSLELRFVQRVRGFCSKMDQIGNESSFFSEEVLIPNLRDLTITRADNLKMIWHNVLVPNSFSKLETVQIESCNNIEKVFPPNIMSVLSCLKSLTIRDCKLLKCIFEVQEANTREKSIDLLSNLRDLILYNLPSLEYVWSKDSCELLIFENIKVLSIEECHKLQRAYPIKFLKQQEYLRIDFNQLKETLEKAKLSVHSNQFPTFQAGTTQLQDGLELFSKLKSLELYGSFEYNSTHLPIEIVQVLHNLESRKDVY
ncbi:probable disease resistance protein At4g27220 [Momordica charantia]|uniref:Probable disease resistance protein At4g27220 n=1 Tax=Momordica charantia TaxID=3673 RepID=A0A6J1DCC9_MOMCH|nr:probable disease resistance protein At4g27220 [Momordica charantia]